MFIDAHCHLEFFNEKQVEEIVDRARKKNVGIMVYNSVNEETAEYALKLSKKYKEIKVALGLYPTDALKLDNKEIDDFINFIRKNNNKIIAIGEVGIDLVENPDFLKQKEIFLKFVNLSRELNIPIIVHSRKAEEKVIEILEREKAKKVIMHCFCGNFKLVDRIVENNWNLTVPTNVTFSEHFQKIVERVDIKNLLCETDSPFLHPTKGMRNNDPSNILESYKKIAEIKKMSLDSVAIEIENNYKKLFKSL